MPRAGRSRPRRAARDARPHAHESSSRDETGRLLEAARPYEESLDPESDDAALVRVTRRDYEKASRVPADLRAEMSRPASNGFQAWHGREASSDFERFLPALERNVELKRRYVELFPEPTSRTTCCSTTTSGA